ncbi:hypothetical protein CDL12_18251 [Handroanthus impetiginosus]|uniref:Uncharacterized protein n=1 Tax=Handroanthus impetiginosus TaxID=429701 RepID=A0A2G9GV57_9LAMI|nr:hypothetical protein CDL12_18251 [Handroanthus impetiginosus]
MLKDEIHTFKQREFETLSGAKDRSKRLLRNCPNHGVSTYAQAHTFYYGLKDTSKQMLDFLRGGSFLFGTTIKLHNLLNQSATNPAREKNERK